MAPLYDIAVVGYGPTGLTAASLLGRLGHRVVVCERWPGLYGLPRLTHIDDETARTVQAAGDADEALRDSSMCEYVWVNGKGETLVTIPANPNGPMGYPDHISMYQPYVESAIDERVRGHGTVDVRQGWAVTGLDQDDDGVTLRLRGWNAQTTRADGPHDEVRARYVIAADGSRSGVRELLGVGREDFGFNEPWVNVDTEWLRPQPPEFAYGKQYCDPARGHMTINIGHTRQRFEFALLPGETREEMTEPETAWRLLREYHGLGPDDVRITRQLVYGFEARIATRWRTGRVFLAGDAAHTMPPYLGQGACSGIRDATNLAWKLHLVLGGQAPDALLDTYESERRPHVTALTHAAIGLGKVANTHDPEAAAARDAAFFAGKVPPPRPFPPLSDGVLRKEAGTPVGTLTPQGRIRLADGRTERLDDLTGYGFTLVAAEDPTASLGPERLARLERLGCAVVALDTVDDLDGRHREYLHLLGAVAYLARPDFILFGTAVDTTDLGALVDDLDAALSGTVGAAV
ncbi:bifunctional 3-(3-hydroxy-phenyl)propionate/3-hydroxycinnamic acid hydroxylase [Streptomyces sp. CA-210063]|uniref:bifunctional 3-(3-hydroxy-phenyl)propionate/3-hydroxycinnamic acid hydroxylase MhpA n=1 Tax=Streptomyces sp. CA-210063 TaxID=2801029 RepID=UPI00214D01D5|nr:bifunctional 3-(3-hydroxy-phenyl)propionate/3-hydroxycinnamic acid hydroxylase [Streptomyces sp. CA-210063]UUU29306.1 bifunctional 3-(3-hydroxy-phenyl)propionate/3-hydroxycinnamic acid hydroxylase [Streptomyces sp. CA-210063]